MPGPYKEACTTAPRDSPIATGLLYDQASHPRGFAEKTHSYHVNAGNWIREHRGIYRLADFPTPERPDLMLWYLWSQNRQESPKDLQS